MTRARDVANLIGSGNYSSTTFTATAGQTVFSIAHTQNFVQVFMNGLLLDETADYTSNGSAVTLTSGAAAGDEIEVVAYNTFSVGDALPKSGGAMTGALTVDAAAATVLTVDRATSDGSIIDVQKDGTSVGSIRSLSGDITIDGPSEHTGLRFEAADITPRHNGAASNNYTSLGTASSRYKDLFLGGGLYIGGTGAANKLSDYETGTFSTALLQATTTTPTISVSANRNKYVKIGRLVLAHYDFSFTISNAGAGDVLLNLPFTVYGTQNYHSVHAQRNCSAFTSPIADYKINGYGGANSTLIYLLYSTGNAGAEAAITTSMLQNGRINLNFIYTTDD